jgi:hypothetical protein
MILERFFMRGRVAERLLHAAVGLALVASAGLLACSNEEASWEVSSSSVGAEIGDRERLDKQWRDDRVDAMATLDEMERSLENAVRGASVADREQLMALGEQIDALRERMLMEFEVPADEATAIREELADDYLETRADVEALLLRLGHSPDEFARWRESS